MSFVGDLERIVSAMEPAKRGNHMAGIFPSGVGEGEAVLHMWNGSQVLVLNDVCLELGFR